MPLVLNRTVNFTREVSSKVISGKEQRIASRFWVPRIHIHRNISYIGDGRISNHIFSSLYSNLKKLRDKCGLQTEIKFYLFPLLKIDLKKLILKPVGLLTLPRLNLVFLQICSPHPFSPPLLTACQWSWPACCSVQISRGNDWACSYISQLTSKLMNSFLLGMKGLRASNEKTSQEF